MWSTWLNDVCADAVPLNPIKEVTDVERAKRGVASSIKFFFFPLAADNVAYVELRKKYSSILSHRFRLLETFISTAHIFSRKNPETISQEFNQSSPIRFPAILFASITAPKWRPLNSWMPRVRFLVFAAVAIQYFIHLTVLMTAIDSLFLAWARGVGHWSTLSPNVPEWMASKEQPCAMLERLLSDPLVISNGLTIDRHRAKIAESYDINNSTNKNRKMCYDWFLPSIR